MNNNLNDIIEIIRIYAKNYVRNNPTWDQPVLVKKIREKALREAEKTLAVKVLEYLNSLSLTIALTINVPL